MTKEFTFDRRNSWIEFLDTLVSHSLCLNIMQFQYVLHCVQFDCKTDLMNFYTSLINIFMIYLMMVLIPHYVVSIHCIKAE
jgi:hypothetical protein